MHLHHHHVETTKPPLHFRTANVAMIVKATCVGSVLGLVGGAVVGAILDGISLITMTHLSGEMLPLVLSLIGGAGTGVAVGGSAFASAYIAAITLQRRKDEANADDLLTELDEHQNIH